MDTDGHGFFEQEGTEEAERFHKVFSIQFSVFRLVDGE
jgi:hypothetical protein